MNTCRIVLSCCLCFSVSAIAAVPNVDTLKTIYKNEMQRFSSERQCERIRAPQKLISSMRELETSYQRAGDLKGVLAVRKERVRFLRNPKVSDIQPVSIPKRLRELQKAYISRSSNIESDYKTAKRELLTKYISALENLKIALTQKGKLESALEVMSEIEELKNQGTPTYSSINDVSPVDDLLSPLDRDQS
jgi:hypothetical protein